jgi:hypothetical protein
MDTPMLSDFPKVRCPFIRQTFDVNKADWKKHGSSLGLREPKVYLAVDQINPGYEWVFEDKHTIAVEKLDGTNIKILMKDGRLVTVQNRLNVIDPLQIMKGKPFLMEGIFQALGKNYIHADGEQAGELIGPKLQGNPYELLVHEWYPFEKAANDLKYKSFHEHERNFDNWSNWFKDFLFSRYYTKKASKAGSDKQVMAEGVIFYNHERKAQGLSYMAKLRRDMFDWYYTDKIEILNYQKSGRTEIENQEEMD